MNIGLVFNFVWRDGKIVLRVEGRNRLEVGEGMKRVLENLNF